MSRALDPQLHTHCIAANIAKGPDGRWTALHHPTIYKAAQTAGYLYQAELRNELSWRLGVEWGPVVHGCADLVQAPVEVLREFSQRRRQIEDAARQAGDDSVGARRRFAVTTRPAKDHQVDGETLVADWQHYRKPTVISAARSAAIARPVS